MGSSTIRERFFEGTLEKGIERFDESVEALLDRLLHSKHTADVGYLGAGIGVREDGCRSWVGWGGKRSRVEYGISRWG